MKTRTQHDRNRFMASMLRKYAELLTLHPTYLLSEDAINGICEMLTENTEDAIKNCEWDYHQEMFMNNWRRKKIQRI